MAIFSELKIADFPGLCVASLRNRDFEGTWFSHHHTIIPSPGFDRLYNSHPHSLALAAELKKVQTKFY